MMKGIAISAEIIMIIIFIVCCFQSLGD